MLACWSAVHAVAGWTASRTYKRAWRGGESFVVDVSLSCWNLYSDDVMSLSMVWSTDALRIRKHSVGLLPVKAMMVMLQVSLENLGAVVLLLIVVGIWCSSAWHVGCGICCGTSAAGMFVDHLACLLARRRRP